MQLMQEKGQLRMTKRIFFGQLLGMRIISAFNLAAEGYNVAKYLPFGPVRDDTYFNKKSRRKYFSGWTN